MVILEILSHVSEVGLLSMVVCVCVCEFCLCFFEGIL